jgi:hypothetical protein
VKKSVKVWQLLPVKPIGAHGCPKADTDGTDSYVTVDLGEKEASKKKLVKTEVIHETSGPLCNFEVSTVRKGLTAWQSH